MVCTELLRGSDRGWLDSNGVVIDGESEVIEAEGEKGDRSLMQILIPKTRYR